MPSSRTQDRRGGRRHIGRRQRARAGQRRRFALDEAGIDLAARHLRVVAPARAGTRDWWSTPAISKCAERLGHASERRARSSAHDDELREQRIVIGRDRVAGAKAGIDADAVALPARASARIVPVDGRKPLAASSA